MFLLLLLFSYKPNKIVPICIAFMDFSGLCTKILTVSNNVLSGLSVLLNFIGAIIKWRRYKTTTFSSESQKSEWRRQINWDVFMSITMIGIVDLLFRAASSILFSIIMLSFSVEMQAMLMPINSVLIPINSTSHLLIYL